MRLKGRRQELNGITLHRKKIKNKAYSSNCLSTNIIYFYIFFPYHLYVLTSEKKKKDRNSRQMAEEYVRAYL